MIIYILISLNYGYYSQQDFFFKFCCKDIKFSTNIPFNRMILNYNTPNYILLNYKTILNTKF